MEPAFKPGKRASISCYYIFSLIDDIFSLIYYIFSLIY